MSVPVAQFELRPSLSVVLDGDDESSNHPDHVHRVRRPDLAGAIRERTGARRDWIAAGRNPASLVVALEIDVLIDGDASSARAHLRRRGEKLFGSTVRYVGTARGLASLILDSYVAEVADAVILHPLDRDHLDPGTTRSLIVREVLPLLRDKIFLRS